MFCTRVAWACLVCLLLCKEEGSSPVSLQKNLFIFIIDPTKFFYNCENCQYLCHKYMIMLICLDMLFYLKYKINMYKVTIFCRILHGSDGWQF